MRVGILLSFHFQPCFHNVLILEGIEIGAVEFGYFLIHVNFVEYVIECVRVETGERPELQSEVLILLLAQVGLLVDVLIITQHRQQLDLFGFAVKGILQVMVVLLTDGDLLLTWLLDLHNGI